MVSHVPLGLNVLIVDTNQPSAQFAGRLSAYMTGRVDNEHANGIAEVYAAKYKEETGCSLVGGTANVSDDDYWTTFFSTWPTHGWFSDEFDNIYQKGQEATAIQAYRFHAAGEIRKLIQKKRAIGTHLLMGETVGNWTCKKVNKAIISHYDEIEHINALRRIQKYPAYLSVGLFFDVALHEALVDFLKMRANQFPMAIADIEKKNGFSVAITGFRLLHIATARRAVPLT